MPYPKEVIQSGDPITVDWGNKVEDNLERLWSYKGLLDLDAGQTFPETADEGDWYWVVSHGRKYIYYFDGTEWKLYIPHGLAPALPEGAIAYWKNTLVDTVNGITPEGFEDSEETDYGLVSDPDGNIVVTRRVDDVPFVGVTSFAVEEGTTNLQASEYTLNHTSGVTIEQINDGKLGHYKISVPAGTYDYLPRVWFTPNTSLTAGETYTSSLYVRWLQGYTSSAFVWLVNVGGGGNDADSTERVMVKDGRAYTVFNGLSSGGEFGISLIFPETLSEDVVVEIWEPQLEQKPFATSFVDGSRVDGKLELPVSLSLDNFVVVWWHKRPFSGNLSRSNTLLHFFGATQEIRVYEGWYNDWRIHEIAGTTDGTVSYNTPEDYLEDGEFAFFVFLRVEGTYKLFINAQKVIEWATPGLVTNDINKLLLGNGLYANLYIGKAKDSSGNLIWTDDYIKMLYTLQKPFVK